MGVAENPDRINHHLRSNAFLLTQIVPTVLLGNATTFTFYHCFVIGNVQNVFGLNIYLVIMAIRKANNGTARCKLWEHCNLAPEVALRSQESDLSCR